MFKLGEPPKVNEEHLQLHCFFFFFFFFYKKTFDKNHQAQNCQKIKNILRIMVRLKYMIKNLESPILILHQESALFTMECLLFTMDTYTFMIEIFLCFSSFLFFALCFALRQMLLLLRGIFYSIYYATWENLKKLLI